MILTYSMQEIIKKKIILIQILVFLIFQLNFIDSTLKPGDGLENLKYASNLSKFNKYTLDINQKESNLREPLYPILLSLNISIVDFFFKNQSKDFKYKNYKVLNIIILLFLGLITYNYSNHLIKSYITSNLCFLFICFGHFFTQTNVFLSESLASIFLISISFYTLKLFRNKFSIKNVLLIFALIGLGSYCKSVFIILIYLYLPILFYFSIKFKNKKILILFFLPYFLLTPLYLWNYSKFKTITLGTENRSSWILAIRSYYLTINPKEYYYSFLYNNPVLKRKFLNQNKIINESVQRIDEINHKYNFYNYGLSYMLNSKKIDENNFVSNVDFYKNYSLEEKNLIKKESIKNILKRPLKHLFVSFLMLYKASSFNDVNSIYYYAKEKSDPIKIYFYIHLIIGFFYIPIFIILTTYYFIKKNKFCFFILPTSILIMTYSLLTFYVPRYNLIFLPVILISISNFLSNHKLGPKSFISLK